MSFFVFFDFVLLFTFFFFQAEDGIRDAQESRGLGDVYKRQEYGEADVGMGAANSATEYAPELIGTLKEAAKPLGNSAKWDLAALLDNIGDSRVVLLGESTHGTHEFYKFRADLTKALIEQKGFNALMLEADWPSCKRVHRYCSTEGSMDQTGEEALGSFSGNFPEWMWRNGVFLDLVDWLKAHNLATATAGGQEVSVFGLDLYSMYDSCLLYTSDAADEEDSVDLGGRRIIKKKKKRICR
eukprot:TRINITY_DN28639_c0_g1_i1.p1 TRINITY_DN28639_c0_g1~~TRINITY_DN28639_c0_g1_i1.p1  ORF type:complete len:241 (-),score=69.87 TRINITY_DN28639_c0_g1_i1:65-787(-)